MHYSQCYLKQTKMISIFVKSYYIHTMILNTFETTESWKVYYFDVYLNMILISILLAKMNNDEISIICILSCQHIKYLLISLH
jgi:hypothetical protein